MRYVPNFRLIVEVDGLRKSEEGIPDPFFRAAVHLSFLDRVAVLFGKSLVVKCEAARGGVMNGVMGALDIELEEQR